MVIDMEKYYATKPYTMQDARHARIMNEHYYDLHENDDDETYFRGLAQYILEKFTTGERLAFVLENPSFYRNWPQYFKEDGSVVV